MRTTIGQLLLNEALPSDLRVDSVLNKGGVSKLLSAVAEKHPQRYGEIVNKIKDVGNHVAYMSGTSFAFQDFTPEHAVRDAAFKDHHGELNALIREALKDPDIQHHPDFIRRKAEVFAKIEEKVNGAIKKKVATAPNNMTAWVASGARGDVSMARQMTAMSGLNVDVSGKLVPDIAKRSFAEGLSPMDFHVHANGARRGVVNTYTSVREPGAFAKELNTITADMVITQRDCGTRRGRVMDSQDRDVLDRHLAVDVPGIGHRNDLLTPMMQEAMKKKHMASVLVRSPLYCEAHEGVCAMCYGPNENGRVPPMGEHVGLRAAQALTEPLTQLALNTKHTGGVVGAGKSPFHQIMQFMHAPKVFVGAATLATRAGKVEGIEASPSGGHNVFVGGVKHYVGPDLKLTVKSGQTVARGDALSTGQPHPVEVVEHKGMEHGRLYFANSVKQLYGDAGINGHGKIFETMSRAVLNLGQVVDPGKHEYVPGEIVHWNSVAKHVEAARTESVPLAKAEGRILASTAHAYAPYQVLTPKAVGDLQAKRVQMVHVYAPGELVVKPVMLGTERAALHKGDWMANLGFRFIGQSFKENAATAAVSDLHSWNPVASYAYGAEFGRGPGGRF